MTDTYERTLPATMGFDVLVLYISFALASCMNVSLYIGERREERERERVEGEQAVGWYKVAKYGTNMHRGAYLYGGVNVHNRITLGGTYACIQNKMHF